MAPREKETPRKMWITGLAEIGGKEAAALFGLVSSLHRNHALHQHAALHV